MNAERWVERARNLDFQIADALAEKEQLLALATDISPKPMDGMPFSNTGTVSQKIPNAVIKLIEQAQKIDKLVEGYIAAKQEIVDVLSKLPENEHDVLYGYYIKKIKDESTGRFMHMTWEQVAEDLGYCSVQVWRIKKKGLKNLENILKCN
jgi:DNA-directed RNA polymerase specialized sigma subunit